MFLVTILSSQAMMWFVDNSFVAYILQFLPPLCLKCMLCLMETELCRALRPLGMKYVV